MLNRRAAVVGLAAFTAARPATRPAAAQTFPSRTITIVVPYTAGGPIDTLARMIAQDAAANLHQSVIVEDRPGGAGIIGANTVARAAPDGHTLVLGTNQTHATDQILIRNCPYDAVKDFAPVAGVAGMPLVLVVRKGLAAASLADFVAMAKANPGKLTYGSTGIGSGPHLATELFKIKAGIDLLHVPFNGLSQMTTELLAERIDLSIAPLPGLITQLIEAGKITALGVARSRRAPQLPSVPTIAEGGVAGVEADAWSALFAPAGTPADTIERLYQAVAAALSKDSIRSNLAAQGILVELKTPAELAEMLPIEVEKWAAVVKAANITVE